MADIQEAKRALVARLLDGDGRAPKDARRSAFANADGATPLSALIGKVALHAHRIEDADYAAVRGEHSEDELFELVVCAAVGQAAREHDAATAALAEALDGGPDAALDP